MSNTEVTETDGAREAPTAQDGEIYPAVTFVSDKTPTLSVVRPDKGGTIRFRGEAGYTTRDPYEIALLDSGRVPDVRRLDDGNDAERERAAAVRQAKEDGTYTGPFGEVAFDDARFARDVNPFDKGQPPLAPGAPVTHGPGVIGHPNDAVSAAEEEPAAASEPAAEEERVVATEEDLEIDTTSADEGEPLSDPADDTGRRF